MIQLHPEDVGRLVLYKQWQRDAKGVKVITTAEKGVLTDFDDTYAFFMPKMGKNPVRAKREFVEFASDDHYSGVAVYDHLHEYLRDFFRLARIELIECLDKKTRRPVPVLAEVKREGNKVHYIPLAKLFTVDPTYSLMPPNPEAGWIEEIEE